MANLAGRSFGAQLMAVLLSLSMVWSSCPVLAQSLSPSALPPPSSLPPPPLPDGAPLESATDPDAETPAPAEAADPDAPVFSLTQGRFGGTGDAAIKSAALRPISREQYDRLMARVSPLKANTEASFKLPTESLQPLPQRPGNVKPVDFPPQASFPAPKAPSKPLLPLRVLRFTPQDKVSEVTTVSITFSQPMVPVTSADKACEKVPAKLSPAADGQWRWLGTQTLVFEPKGKKFPRSTEFTVTIPADVVSDAGAKVEREISYKFQTPTIEVSSFVPQVQDSELNPTIYATFSQKIDTTRVFKQMLLTSGKTAYQLRLLSKSEVPAKEVKEFEKDTPGRWIACKTTQALPKNTKFKLTFKPGLPSEEGPLLLTASPSYEFRTFGPFVINWRDTETKLESASWIPPIYFSNRLAANTPALIKKVSITPAVRNFMPVQDSYQGTYISLQGRFKPNTTYKVTFDRAIKDCHGQPLSGSNVVTFTTGEDGIYIRNSVFTTLVPAREVNFGIQTEGATTLKVSVYKVAPKDTIPILSVSEYDNLDSKVLKKLEPKRIWSGTIKVRQDDDSTPIVTPFDLSRFLPKGFGHLILDVDTGKKERKLLVVQVSDLGVEAFTDDSSVLARVFSIRSGLPLKGIEVDFESNGGKVTSDQNGLARLNLTNTEQRMILVRRGDDVSMLPRKAEYSDHYDRIWKRTEKDPYICWFAQTDRELYRPGETMHVKGWLRVRTEGKDSALNAITDKNRVKVLISDTQSNSILEEIHDIDRLGGFDFKATIPKNANLGQGDIALYVLNEEGREDSARYRQTSYHQRFKIEEFRRPEFELSVSPDQAAPYFDGDEFSFTATAKYFSGGPLPQTPIVWDVEASASSYSPPGWSEFQFGDGSHWCDWFFAELPSSIARKSLSATTDAAGKHSASIKVMKLVRRYPHTFEIASTITDVNRQNWMDKQSVLVHPGSFCVGLKQEKRFIQAGEAIELKFAVCDVDGKAAKRKVKFDIEREITTTTDKGQSKTTRDKVATKELESDQEPRTMEFADTKSGTYYITAMVTDDKGRRSDTQISVWVAGDVPPVTTRMEQGEIRVVADKETYRIGQSARLLVLPPFYPFVGLMTLRNHETIVSSRSFKCEKGFAMVEVPLNEHSVPTMNVQIDAIGKQTSTVTTSTESGGTKQTKKMLPAFAKGKIELSVPPEHHKISVTVAPVKKGIEPGGETEVDIDLKDNQGQPIEGQVAIAAVDEAVLALAGYQQSNPIDAFYPKSDDSVDSQYLMNELQVPIETEKRKSQKNGKGLPPPRPVPSGAAGGAAASDMASLPPPSSLPPPPLPGAPDGSLPEPAVGAGGSQIKVRSDFNPLALFKAVVETDKSGHARVKVKVPDSLTRYRVMVWAISGVERAGIGDGNVTARLPLMVRPSLPRFLNFGDKAELPVVLQNQTDDPLEAEVAIRSNGLKLEDVPGGAVTVPANDRVEVRFPAQTLSAGEATVQLAAASGAFADAAEQALPIYTPATTESFATYGQVDQGMAVQSIETPADVLAETGSLDVTTCSTALGGLEDAYFDLRNYRFECSEQISARLLAMLALKDVMSAFGKSDATSEAKTKEFIENDIKVLVSRLRYNGGFGLWSKSESEKEWPYVSCQVARALHMAASKGFEVPSHVTLKNAEYLRHIDRYLPLKANSISDMCYSEKTRRALLAYAQYVLYLMNKAEVFESSKLLAETLKEMDSTGKAKEVEWIFYSPSSGTAETLAWLLPILSKDEKSKALVETARTKIDSCISETAAGAEIASDSYDNDSYLIFHSPRRSSAVVLESMMQDQPENPIIPKLVNHLMAVREKGKWNGTQENYYILCALDRYFAKYEKERPDFRVQMWLGPDFASNQSFKGRSSDSNLLRVPMAFLTARPARQDLTIQKDGPGRLYYRIGMKYAPKGLMLDARDRGFGVDRKYSALDDKNKGDVTVDKDGVVHVKAGATVKITLTINNAASRHHVALVDPIPAGFEILNPALKGTSSTSRRTTGDKPFWYWWDRYWFDHHNFKDDRAEVFSSLLWGGNREYEYFARATTPGSYIVPPTRAEEMYAPETFGRSASARVVVEE